MSKPDQFQQDTQNFVTWLTDVGHLNLSPKIEILDLRSSHEGRAVVAKENILKDEVLFEIPHSSLININTSQIVEDFPHIENKLGQLGQWNGLIICLLYEWKILKEKSKWWPYLKVLPNSSTLNGLMYWSDEDLKSLKPSLVLERIGKEGSKQMYGTILKFLEENKIEATFKSTTWDDFLQVASTIMSYSFDVGNAESSEDTNENDDDEDEEDDEMASIKSMVPFADTLNADTHKCNANLMYDKGTLKMCAIKPLKKGDQVYNFYGEHPNSEILRRYGYVEVDGSAYDFGEVLISNIREAFRDNMSVDDNFIDWTFDTLQNDEAIQELLDGDDIVLDSYDCYISGEILTEVVVLLQILSIFFQIPNINDFYETGGERELRRVTKKCIQLVESERVTDKCTDIWKSAVQKRLSEYPKNISERIVKINDNKSTHELRKLMACIVLKSECRSLSKCESSINDQYKIIEDKKLLNNILKRKLDTSKDGKTNNKKART